MRSQWTDNIFLVVSDGRGDPCFFPDLTGKPFNLSLLSVVWTVGLLYVGFVVFAEAFVTKGCCILQMLFLHLWRRSRDFQLHSIMWSIICISFHLRDKSHLITMSDSFNVLLNLACECIVGNFCIFIHQGCWSVCFFSCSVLMWLWYQSNAGLSKWVWEYSLFFNVVKECDKDWC